MDTLRIPIQGSSGLYEVFLEWTGDRLKVRCNCKAGIFGQLCKHKTRLLAGDTSIIAVAGAEDAEELMGRVRICLDKAGHETLETFARDIQTREAEKTKIEKRLKDRKADFARQLAEGLPASL